ncbi:hypothetical protein ABI59_00300 [Acidobacteria bacterium Mor1]|nr:hypothetical protein ABI59_00300 [Acidobacteria bacterium Mor1]
MTRRLGLRVRLALWLGLLVAATVSILAVAAHWIVVDSLDTQRRQRLQLTADSVERGLAREQGELRGRLATLAEALGEDRELMQRLLSAGATVPAEVYEAGGRMMRLSGLDLFEIRDEAGRVLTSGHRPEAVGSTIRSANADGGSSMESANADGIAWVGDGDERLLAWTASRRIEAGDRALILFAGRKLDAGFFDRFQGTEQVALASPSSAPMKTARTLRRDLSVVDGPAQQLLFIAQAPGEAQLLRRLRLGFLMAGLVGTLLAGLAGAWIAGKVTRPIGQLIEAVEAIGRGDADYTYPRSGGDEVDDLVEAFSRTQRSLEQQQTRALAAERVAAWREIARRVAHEIKNPLAPIRLTVENLTKARKRSPELFDEMFDEGSATILEEVQQLQKLVTEFASFARLPEPTRVPRNLGEVIDSVIALYQGNSDLAISAHRDGQPIVFSLDADQIAQALKNLVGNAVEAQQGKGVVEVVAERDAGSVTLIVRDEGPGFDEETARRLFEPYFTTKETGTGLGMAIVHRIVSEHGGMVTAGNRTDRGGAQVRIEFPIHEEG